jgi:hypothetical protein
VESVGGTWALPLPRQYERAIDPKKFVALKGAAHAPAIFLTPEGDRLMREVLKFLDP